MQQELSQHNRAILLHTFRREYKRDSLSGAQLLQRFNFQRIFYEFITVTLAKPCPSFWTMSEPGTQLR